MQNNNCDGSGPCTPGTVKTLRTTWGSNAILCRACHAREIQWRKERNRELGKAEQFTLPSWDSLKVYTTS